MARITYADIKGHFSSDLLKVRDVVTAQVVETITGVDPTDDLDDFETIIQPDGGYCSDILGHTRLFETFARDSRYGGWRYMGLCEEGKTHNRHPEKAKKVFICSPYHVNPEFCTKLAKAVCVQIASEGDIPIAPHLYFPQFLPDEGFNRDWGIIAGHELMKICDEMIVIEVNGYCSDGMKRDIEYAVNNLALDPRTIRFTRKEAEVFVDKHLRSEV